MGVALDAGLDLSGLVGCFVLIGLLAVVGFTFERLADVLDVGMFGVHPFSGIAGAIRGTIVDGCNSGIKALEKQAAKFLSGLIDVFGLLLALPILLGLGTKAAFEYLWNHALDPRIEHVAGPIRSGVNQAIGRVNTISGDIYDLTRALPHKIASAVDAGVSEAERFTVSRVNAAERELRSVIGSNIARVERELTAAIRTAEAYTDTAIDRLQATEDAAIRSARELAASQLHDAIARIESELSGVRSDLTGQLTAARHELSAAIDQARAAASAEVESVKAQAQAALGDAVASGQAALERVRAELASATAEAQDLAGRIGRDLGSLEGTLGLAGAAAAIAAIPAIQALVNAIADEAGLGNRECRGKVKNICGTPASRWAHLLGSLVPLAAALSVGELLDLIRHQYEAHVDDAIDLVREAF